MDKLDQIRISGSSGSVTVNNPTNFQLLGKGWQGAVFRIDEHRCVKIYSDEEDLKRELRALQLGNKIGICPKVFLAGDNFIVMEYLSYPSLEEYLDKNPITRDLAAKIINLLESFKSIGFNRFDHSLRHIYLVPEGKLKVIDLVHVIKVKPVFLPEKILKELGANAETFIQFVKEMSPKWYERWTRHPDFPALLEMIRERA